MQTIKLKDKAFEELKLLSKSNPSNEELAGAAGLDASDDRNVAYNLGLEHGFEYGQRDLAKWMFDFGSAGGAAEPADTPIMEKPEADMKQNESAFKIGDHVSFKPETLAYLKRHTAVRPVPLINSIGVITDVSPATEVKPEATYSVAVQMSHNTGGSVVIRTFENMRANQLISTKKTVVSEAIDFTQNSDLTEDEANTIVNLIASGVASADKVLAYVSKLIKKKKSKK